MRKDQYDEICSLINEIEEKIKCSPDYQNIVIIHENMQRINEKVDKILEYLER